MAGPVRGQGWKENPAWCPLLQPHRAAPFPAAYQVTHCLNNTAATAATVEVLEPSARQYTATGLQPEATYLFRIAAQTRKGWGEAAEALVVTTEKRGNGRGVSVPWWGVLCVPTACPQCSQPFASPRPSAAPREAAGAAGGGASPQRAALLGAGQRRALPRPLLHGADPGAARWRVGTAFCLRQPQCHRLRRGQVRHGLVLISAAGVMGSRANHGLCFGWLPHASVSPSDEKCWHQGWEALANVPCGKEGGLLVGSPTGFTVPIPLPSHPG